MSEPVTIPGVSIAILPDAEPHKICPRCTKDQILMAYPVNEVTSDGRDSICTRCRTWHDTVLRVQARKRAKPGQRKRKAPVTSDEFVPLDEKGTGPGDETTATPFSDSPVGVRDSRGDMGTIVHEDSSDDQFGDDTEKVDGISGVMGVSKKRQASAMPSMASTS